MGLKIDDLYIGMVIEADTDYISNRFKVLSISKDRVYTEYLTDHFPYSILPRDIGSFRAYDPDLYFYKDLINLKE